MIARDTGCALRRRRRRPRTRAARLRRLRPARCRSGLRRRARSGTDEGQSPAVTRADRQRERQAIAIEERLPQPRVALGLEREQRVVHGRNVSIALTPSSRTQPCADGRARGCGTTAPRRARGRASARSAPSRARRRRDARAASVASVPAPPSSSAMTECSATRPRKPHAAAGERPERGERGGESALHVAGAATETRRRRGWSPSHGSTRPLREIADRARRRRGR